MATPRTGTGQNTPGSAASCELAEYVTKLFDRYADHRKKTREPKWNRNLTDFRGEWRNLFWKQNDGKDWRSKAVANIARQKATTAFALIIDLAIENGRIRFAMQPSKRLLADDINAAESFKAALDAAEDVITDQFDRCHADRQMINNVWSLVMMGETFAKFTRRTWTDTGWQPISAPGIDDMSSLPAESLQWEETKTEESGPAWEFTSNWEMFCDPEHGGDPRAGRGPIQRRMISVRELRKKKGRFLYLDNEIEAAIVAARTKYAGSEKAEDDSSLPPALRDICDGERKVRNLEAWVYAPRSKVEKFAEKIASGEGGDGYSVPSFTYREGDEDDGDEVFSLIEMADDHIIRIAIVDPEENPFFRAVAEQQPDEPLPRGVVDNAQASHDGASKTLRAIEDNLNWCNNPVFARIRRMFKGMPPVIEPGATYDLDDAQTDDARKAMAQIKMDPMIEGLTVLLGLWEKYGDWDTSLAKITQGQIERNSATATEIMEQAERGDKYTATIMRNIDDGLTEPMGTRFFSENMTDPTITLGKGDFRFKAQGWEAQQTRIARVKALRTLLEVVLMDPDFKSWIKPLGFLEPMTKNATLDKDSLLKTVEEHDTDMQAQAEADRRLLALEQAKTEATVQKTLADAERSTADAEAKRAQVEQNDERLTMDRAKAVTEIERTATQNQGEPA